MPVPQNPVVKAVKATVTRQRELIAKEVPSANLLNNTGVTLVAGDVVLLSTASDRTVVLAGDPAASLHPLVVLIGGPADEVIKCVLPGSGIVPVLVHGAAIAPGDKVIASATPKYGKVLEAEVAFAPIGIAIIAKAGGVTQAVATMLISWL